MSAQMAIEDYAAALGEAHRLWATDRETYVSRLHPDLRPYVNAAGGHPLLIMHPFAYVLVPEPPEVISERFAFKRQRVASALSEGNIQEAMVWVESPNALMLLDCLVHAPLDAVYLPGFTHMFEFKRPPKRDPVWSEAFVDAWIRTERPHQYGRNVILRLAKDCAQDPDNIWHCDSTGFTKPQVPLTLFRGGQRAKADRRGMSWTSNQTQAEWFAKRWSGKGRPPIVLKETFPPERILGYFEGRGEREWLVNTRGWPLAHIQEVGLLPRPDIRSIRIGEE